MVTPKLYLETSVVSYLTAQWSRDLILVAHQEITRAWWASRAGFDVYQLELQAYRQCAAPEQD